MKYIVPSSTTQILHSGSAKYAIANSRGTFGVVKRPTVPKLPSGPICYDLSSIIVVYILCIRIRKTMSSTGLLNLPTF